MIPFRDANPSHTVPFITIGIILANVAAFLYEVNLGEPALEGFILTWGLIPATATGAVDVPGFTGTDVAIRFLTSMFLHGGWFHLIGNMWYLWIFGDNVEDRLGHGRYLLFYLASGIAADGAHILSSPSSVIPVVGASGAIAGVLGAYLITFPRARITSFVPVFFYPMFINLPAILVLGMWFVVQILNGSASIGAATAETTGGVAWWAHVGGFATGIVLMLVIPKRRRTRREMTPGYRRLRW